MNAIDLMSVRLNLIVFCKVHDWSPLMQTFLYTLSFFKRISCKWWKAMRVWNEVEYMLCMSLHIWLCKKKNQIKPFDTEHLQYSSTFISGALSKCVCVHFGSDVCDVRLSYYELGWQHFHVSELILDYRELTSISQSKDYSWDYKALHT